MGDPVDALYRQSALLRVEEEEEEGMAMASIRGGCWAELGRGSGRSGQHWLAGWLTMLAALGWRAGARGTGAEAGNWAE